MGVVNKQSPRVTPLIFTAINPWHYNDNIIILGNSLFLENPQKRKQPLDYTQVTVAPISLLFPRGNDVPSMMKVILGH